MFSKLVEACWYAQMDLTHCAACEGSQPVVIVTGCPWELNSMTDGTARLRIHRRSVRSLDDVSRNVCTEISSKIDCETKLRAWIAYVLGGHANEVWQIFTLREHWSMAAEGTSTRV